MTGSRMVAAALLVLGALGAVAAALSALPRGAAVCTALAAIGYGVLAARRELGRAAVRIDFLPCGAVLVDDAPLESPRLQWQGPIAILDGGVDGRRFRILGWPDVLPRTARRELRLWALESRTAREPATMAP